MCREARTAALEFLSLRIPCANLDALVPLYFSPERDVLYIDQKPHTGLAWLAGLLPQLTTYDSRGVGVRNLAINHHPIGEYPWNIVAGYLDRLDAPALRAFAEAVARLRQLWAMTVEKDRGRVMPAGMNFGDSKAHHNRSVPAFPPFQTFTRIPGTDPRPIEQDLGYVTTYYPPQELVNRWRRLEKHLDIDRRRSNSNREQPQQPSPPLPELEIRVLVAADTTASSDEDTIIDHATAQEFFAKEDIAFREYTSTKVRRPIPYWGNYLDSEDEWAGLRSRLPDAVGFWLFPADAFADHLAENGLVAVNLVRDMRGHRPELCVFDMD